MKPPGWPDRGPLPSVLQLMPPDRFVDDCGHVRGWGELRPSWRHFWVGNINLGFPANCATPNRLHDWFCARSRRWVSHRFSRVRPKWVGGDVIGLLLINGPTLTLDTYRALPFPSREYVARWRLSGGFLAEWVTSAERALMSAREYADGR